MAKSFIAPEISIWEFFCIYFSNWSAWLLPLATTMEFCFRNKLLSFAERYQNPMSLFLGKYTSALWSSHGEHQAHFPMWPETEEGGARWFLCKKKLFYCFNIWLASGLFMCCTMKIEEGREIWFFLLLFHASVLEQELNLKPRTKSSAAATAVAITCNDCDRPCI
jgi:hypothetical protein